MADLLIVIVIGLVLSIAITYIVKQKKAGVRCIGCSHACTCSKKSKCDSNSLVSQYKNKEVA